MRVLVSCLQALKEHRIPAYGFWRTNFLRGIEEAGHEPLEVPGVDWAEGLACDDGPALEEWRGRTWGAVQDFVRGQSLIAPIDLFIGYLYPRQIERAAIRELQRLGTPCVNFFCDNVREFRHVPSEFAPFDLHWVPEFEALPMYKAAGWAHIHAAMPCWVPKHLRTPPERETELPNFIGSTDALRRNLLGAALSEGAEFLIRGKGWNVENSARNKAPARRSGFVGKVIRQLALARSHGVGAVVHKIEQRVRPLRGAPIPTSSIADAPVGMEEYHRLTREAMVTLGVNRVPTAHAPLRRPIVYSRLRDIEAPMLGACYLTEWTAGLEHMYRLGSEIETYRTSQELVAKLTELRTNRERREAMRRSAQKRALEEHSVVRSVARIAERLGVRA